MHCDIFRHKMPDDELLNRTLKSLRQRIEVKVRSSSIIAVGCFEEGSRAVIKVAGIKAQSLGTYTEPLTDRGLPGIAQSGTFPSTGSQDLEVLSQQDEVPPQRAVLLGYA